MVIARSVSLSSRHFQRRRRFADHLAGVRPDQAHAEHKVAIELSAIFVNPSPLHTMPTARPHRAPRHFQDRARRRLPPRALLEQSHVRQLRIGEDRRWNRAGIEHAASAGDDLRRDAFRAMALSASSSPPTASPAANARITQCAASSHRPRQIPAIDFRLRLFQLQAAQCCQCDRLRRPRSRTAPACR